VTGIEIKQNISVLQCQTRRKIQFAMGGDCGGGLFCVDTVDVATYKEDSIQAKKKIQIHK